MCVFFVGLEDVFFWRSRKIWVGYDHLFSMNVNIILRRGVGCLLYYLTFACYPCLSSPVSFFLSFFFLGGSRLWCFCLLMYVFVSAFFFALFFIVVSCLLGASFTYKNVPLSLCFLFVDSSILKR